MKNIITGMDINLASLLIPYYSGSGVMETDYLGVDNWQVPKRKARPQDKQGSNAEWIYPGFWDLKKHHVFSISQS